MGSGADLDEEIDELGRGDFEEIDEIGRIMAEVGRVSGAVVRVDRIKDNGKTEFVDEYPAEGFNLKSIQETYGGGEFMITARQGGKFVKGMKNARISIAQPLKPAAAAPADQVGAIAQMLQEQTRAIVEVLRQTQPAAPPPSRAELLAELKTMREVFGPVAPAGETMGPEKVLELLRMGMEFKREAEGGDNEGGGVMGVIEKAIETLGPSLAAVVERAAAAPPVVVHAPALPRQPAAAPVVVVPPQEAPKPKEEQSPMKQYVALLVANAALGIDPGTVADVIVQKIDEGAISEEQIREFLTGDPVEKLAAFDKRVKARPEWFRELGAAILEILDAVEPAELPAADEVSSSGNP